MQQLKYEEKLIQMCILLDDFCKAYHAWQQSRQMADRTVVTTGQCQLASSEILASLIYYHYSDISVFHTTISEWSCREVYSLTFLRQ